MIRETETLSVQNASYQEKFNDIKHRFERERTDREYSERNYEE